MNWTRVGGVILVLMDFCDILLPVSSGGRARDVGNEGERGVELEHSAETLSWDRIARQNLQIHVPPPPHRLHLCPLPPLLANHPSNRFLHRFPLHHPSSTLYPPLGLDPRGRTLCQCVDGSWVSEPFGGIVGDELYLVLDGLYGGLEGDHGSGGG